MQALKQAFSLRGIEAEPRDVVKNTTSTRHSGKITFDDLKSVAKELGIRKRNVLNHASAFLVIWRSVMMKEANPQQSVRDTCSSLSDM